MMVDETARWVSYDEAAIPLGISPEATKRRALRGRWPRRADPSGATQVALPEPVPNRASEDA